MQINTSLGWITTDFNRFVCGASKRIYLEEFLSFDLVCVPLSGPESFQRILLQQLQMDDQTNELYLKLICGTSYQSSIMLNIFWLLPSQNLKLKTFRFLNTAKNVEAELMGNEVKHEVLISQVTVFNLELCEQQLRALQTKVSLTGNMQESWR